MYKNIDDACPLFISGWKTDVSSEIKGISDLSAEAKAKYETKIDGLLYSLNEQNQSLMMSFRTVYLAYSANPCDNDDFFKREIEKLLDEQRKISALKIQIAGLIQLASANPKDTAGVTKIFGDIASRLGGASVPAAASLEIAEARGVAQNLIQEN
ncbi:hypothetical protein [Paraburkholderia tropica]|uniref:hypothetical protein n=1 Tax=Paraburkholderia tropica TaxID=92647 RepID=UPI002AB2A120|nr:hypothetical protein [Paraburkholderia tropica]